jgi:hypothetical protein
METVIFHVITLAIIGVFAGEAGLLEERVPVTQTRSWRYRSRRRCPGLESVSARQDWLGRESAMK